MNSKELRERYLKFFKSRGHTVLPSASLIPENDPTVLFTTAGMHPLVPYLLGEQHPEGRRLTNVQKSIRTQDIDEVGDQTHHTFFEMLGNWSLGDPAASDGIGEAGYWKKQAIEWSWEFLASQDWLRLDPKKIAISVFKGDKDAPKDEESAKIWKSLGIPGHKISYLGKEENWWGPAGQTGPCGPDTEMFYWIGQAENPSEKSNPGDDEDNWLEIWNDVFMEYDKTEKGEYVPLKQKNVDTGMGLERTLMALNNLDDVYLVDTFKPIIERTEKISGLKYLADEKITKSMRVIADHMRTSVMIMADDARITPSNAEQGYIVRRLIRRAIRHARVLKIDDKFCVQVAEPVIKIFKDVYPEVEKNKNFVFEQLEKEEQQFSQVVTRGLKEFEKEIKKLSNNEINGQVAFNLFQTYGFPLEITQELAREKNLNVDEKGFIKEFKKHQELSRAGADIKFSGGLADHSEQTTKLHTANHLLQAALRRVLGEHVKQKGSNITKDRLRFDFTHSEKMSDDDKQRVEDLVNRAIQKDYPVSFEEMTIAEAKKRGALGFFEKRYSKKVKVFTIGDPLTPPTGNPDDPTFSMEICGGPHVKHTGVIGQFKITKEEAVSTGVRRIKAIIK